MVKFLGAILRKHINITEKKTSKYWTSLQRKISTDSKILEKYLKKMLEKYAKIA